MNLAPKSAFTSKASIWNGVGGQDPLLRIKSEPYEPIPYASEQGIF